MTRLWRTVCVLGMLPLTTLGQSRFDEGEWKGFTKSPTEHIINRYESVIMLRTFEGRIVDPTGVPLSGVVVEVRGPGANQKVRGIVTDERGRFKLGHLSRGSYAFKVTLNTFQSIVGALEITRSATRSVPFRLVLRFGV